MITTPKDMVSGVAHKTNSSGTLEIVKYFKTDKVSVRFLGTGYKSIAAAVSIRRGEVKDRLRPSVYGVGYIGSGSRKMSKNGKDTLEYKTWQRMLERCYSEKYHDRKPTYIGCSVCSEWHDFQVFAKWFDDNYIEGCELDKDIKIHGNKEYNPGSCSFVSKIVNVQKSTAKDFVMKSPSGEIVIINNISKFCRDNNINHSAMRSVIVGCRPSNFRWEFIKRGDHY